MSKKQYLLYDNERDVWFPVPEDFIKGIRKEVIKAIKKELDEMREYNKVADKSDGKWIDGYNIAIDTIDTAIDMIESKLKVKK